MDISKAVHNAFAFPYCLKSRRSKSHVIISDLDAAWL